MLRFVCMILLAGAISAAAATKDEMPNNPTQSLGIAYRSTENPYYWKNRPPDAGYWQQDVYYRMQAKLDATSRIITGHEVLTYYNNSPDTLDFVYFHLYQNAFRKGSYEDLQRRTHNDYSLEQLPERAQGGTDIDRIVDGAGQPLTTKLDNTILWVKLNNALVPGDSTVFEIDFKTYFGSIRRRMKYNPRFGFDQFDATQWYPRISVYDRKFGWTTDQHLGHEFYGDFGAFEVDLTLPNDFIVGATGYLLNRDEVLPPELMQKLDIKNFADKPYGERPSTVIARLPDSTKTWRYKAVNVHDFAWTADPSYRIGVAEWDGITCYALAREWKAAKWQDAAHFAAEIIRVYSTDFGRYGYHKMIVADADDGMEYPMLTLDGSRSPNYYGLLAHEIGHNWFFGMVGNNETYRAFLDEGFTQFLTSWSIGKLVRQTDSPANKQFEFANDERERYGNYAAYYGSVSSNQDVRLNTHSDRYNLTTGGEGAYGQVYFKTAVMQYALQYVLGEDLHRRAMAYYFNTWKFCHPYPEDFRDAIIHYTHQDLGWFFDAWMDEAYAVDYALAKFHRRPEGDHWVAEVKIRRKGRAVMPLDLVFKLSDGTTRLAIVPVSDAAKTEGDPIVLPKWFGWGDLNPTYTAQVVLPAKPVSVAIDPSGRMADVYTLDNDSGFLPRMQFSPQWRDIDWPLDKYLVQWRPNLWYNDVDGARIGVNLVGAYRNNWGFGDHQIELTPSLGANFPDRPLSYTFRYQQPLRRVARYAFFTITSQIKNGYSAHGIAFYQRFVQNPPSNSQYTTLNIGVAFARQFDRSYLWAPALWNDRPYNTLRANLARQYSYGPRGQSRGKVVLRMTTALGGAEQQFSRVTLASVQNLRLGGVDLRLRGIVGYATAEVPPQAALYLSAGSPDEWITSQWLGARGNLPTPWAQDGHLHPAGGGNLRAQHITAFSAFADAPAGSATAGNRLAAANAELGLWNPITRVLAAIPNLGDLLQFDLYAFGDVGAQNFVNADDVFKVGEATFDAGFGIHWQPRLPWRWRQLLSEVLSFRVDFPIYLSKAPAGEDRLAFRWLLGVGRAF